MRIQCSSFWPSMFTSQSSLNSFSSVKPHSYFCYSEVCPHRFFKSQRARNSCQMSASFRATTDNLLSQHLTAEHSSHVVLLLIVWWIGKTLCKIQQLHWWEKLLNSTCIVKKDHLLIFHCPSFCSWVSVWFLSGRIMQLVQWEYTCTYVRKKEKREIRSRIPFSYDSEFPCGTDSYKTPARTGIHQCSLSSLGCLSRKCRQLWFCVV